MKQPSPPAQHSLIRLRGAERAPVAAARGWRNGMVVAWARHTEDVRQAQRLRFDVFARELGAKLNTPLPGHDIDRFDDYCEHLLVRDGTTRDVIGTYRMLTPAQARRAGGTYCDGEFDLAPLDALRPRMVELGRSCVHADYRQGSVILLLWGALAEFMIRNQLDTMIGCASIPLRQPSSRVGEGAGRVEATRSWQLLLRENLAPPQYRVVPHLPLPWPPAISDGFLTDSEPPALIKGYLRLGAKVLGPPAWDPDFNTADLPMLMRTADLPVRYRQVAARS